MTTQTTDTPATMSNPEPFGAELVPFPVEDHLPGLPSPRRVAELLREQFVAAVARERDRRGLVTDQTDVWPMVRAVEGFRDLVDDYARSLTGVAKTAKAVLEEELFEAVPEQDGIPQGSLRVPQIGGGVISVRPKTANEYAFDEQQVCAALAVVVAAEWQRDESMPDPAADPEQFGMAVAERVLVMVGAKALKVTHVRALADTLAQRGDDSLARVVLDAISKKRIYKGIDVETKESA